MKTQITKHIGRTLWAKLDIAEAQVPGELRDLLERLRRAERRREKRRSRDVEQPGPKRHSARTR